MNPQSALPQKWNSKGKPFQSLFIIQTYSSLTMQMVPGIPLFPALTRP